MSRETIYKCDNCRKILSSSKVAKEHISIATIDDCGWVYKKKNMWLFTRSSSAEGIYQFCDGACIGDYFDKKKPKEEVKEIPQFKGTRKSLGRLTILKDKEKQNEED